MITFNPFGNEWINLHPRTASRSVAIRVLKGYIYLLYVIKTEKSYMYVVFVKLDHFEYTTVMTL